MSRVGVIAKKIGMSAVFSSDGARVPVTMLQLDNCHVVGKREQSRDGYTALQVGATDFKNIAKVSKPMQGFFKKNNVSPKKKIAEFRVSEGAMLDVGSKIDVDHYVPGQFIDVSGTSIGKGFAGVMKRHNFGGLRASHGVSVSHRSHGSTGQCQDPGRVFKGKKMAGQMGNVGVTVQNLKIISVDKENGVILVKGAVPGSKSSYVIVNDAVKRALPGDAPYPGVKKSENVEAPIENVEVQESPNIDSAESVDVVKDSGVSEEASNKEDENKQVD
ncbi:MAG: 50S ribosomal protein L3 [Alphaproteobacteria bacterium]|nr:50S ribosomal protein L3 [Alphaproteobacteria bacterium]